MSESYLSFSLVSAIATAVIAHYHGRSAWAWFFLGGIFPVLSLILLLVFLDPLNRTVPIAPPAFVAAPVDPAAWPSVTDAAKALPQEGWFYSDRRAAHGPVTLPYLRGSIQSGALRKDTPVWCPVFRDWVTPARVPGFFG